MESDQSQSSSLPCADKLAFDTKEQAEATATVTEWQHGTRVRVYHCQHCSLWHLSSTNFTD
ncbi:MAG TPA: hypothetical protein VK694_03430 [Verrucomicrobiae bacterium]|nr:hypothetical protein [Verrucomicrobiae bacterium]